MEKKSKLDALRQRLSKEPSTESLPNEQPKIKTKEEPVAEEIIKVKNKKAAPKSETVKELAPEKKPVVEKGKEVENGSWIDEWL